MPIIYMHGVVYASEIVLLASLVVEYYLQTVHLTVKAEQAAMFAVNVERAVQDRMRDDGRAGCKAYLIDFRAVFFGKLYARDVIKVFHSTKDNVGRNKGEVPDVEIDQDGRKAQEDVQVGPAKSGKAGTVELVFSQLAPTSAVECNIANLNT